jgi:hypothetical protein
MIKLVDLFEQKYGKLILGIPLLEVGEYEVKNFFILDNADYIKYLYLDTELGMFKTASKNLIVSILGGLGVLLQEQFEKGQTVLIEVVNQRKKTGKFGLAIRTV